MYYCNSHRAVFFLLRRFHTIVVLIQTRSTGRHSMTGYKKNTPECIFIPGTSSTLDGFFNKLAGPEFFFRNVRVYLSSSAFPAIPDVIGKGEEKRREPGTMRYFMEDPNRSRQPHHTGRDLCKERSKSFLKK